MDTKYIGKKLPIGYEDFKRIIVEKLYYVDKTLFLRDLQENGGNVNLFLRPRRFGKTLMLSTIKYFYENTGDEILNAENRALFDGLKISQVDEAYCKNMTSCPVINLTLKSAKQPSFKEAIGILRADIRYETKRQVEIVEKSGIKHEDLEINKLLEYTDDENTETDQLIKRALLVLSKYLYSVYKKKVIILIDEYDVPLENSFFRGFYDKMIDFIRTLFESGLKTNPYLEFAVITGCLRVSKESLFTGMNNLRVVTMDNKNFSEYFGFSQSEVDIALEDFESLELRDEMKRWYNGYRFGNEGIYNPWSVVNVLANLRVKEIIIFKSFWANTSGNDIIRTLIERSDERVRLDIEMLMEGGTVEKPIHEDVTYADMLESDDNLFNFLYFTGYLTAESIEKEGDNHIAKLIVPNAEVMTIYNRKIIEWFNKKNADRDFSALHKAIEEGSVETIKDIIDSELEETISYFNYNEAYYHGFLLGLLKGNSKRVVRSDRESGLDRYDIAMIPKKRTNSVIIIEIKRTSDVRKIDAKMAEAVEQIKVKDYSKGFYKDGYETFMVYAAVFFRKSVEIRLVRG